MRLLFLLHGRTVEDHPGFHDAFLTLEKEGELASYDVIPILKFSETYGWDCFYEEVVQRSKAQDVDLVFFQFFHSPQIPSPHTCISKLRQLESNPIIVVSAGDAFSTLPLDRAYFPQCLRISSRLADMTFMTSMGRCARYIAKLGAKNLVFLPHAVCQARFHLEECIANVGEEAEFDVGFVGRHLKIRRPTNIMLYRFSSQRAKLVKLLWKRYGNRFVVYGSGWGNQPYSKGFLPYEDQASLGKKVRVLFGGYPCTKARYYASDRIFVQGVSSAQFVDWQVDGLDKFLRNGEHWDDCEDSRTMVKKIDQLLNTDPAILRQKVISRIHYMFSRHTIYHRMRFLVETSRSFQNAKRQGVAAPKPQFPFFLPEVDLKEEMKYAVCNWAG